MCSPVYHSPVLPFYTPSKFILLDLTLTEFKFANLVKYRGCYQLYSKTLLPIAFCMGFSSFLLQSVISRAFSERLAPKDGCHLSAGCLELLVVNLLEGKDGKNPGNTGCQMQVMVLICDPNASGCWSGGC